MARYQGCWITEVQPTLDNFIYNVFLNEGCHISSYYSCSPMSYMEDSASEGGQTFATFLSGISDCDNVTFKKIKRYWENNSAKHKEVSDSLYQNRIE